MPPLVYVSNRSAERSSELTPKTHDEARIRDGVMFFQRKLKNKSTKSEIKLWQYLKSKKMMGYDFHRQKPIDKFILDFFCNKLILAIELDGYTHTFEEIAEKDAVKQERLRNLG